MQLTLKHFSRHTDGSPGDNMVVQIQQMGENTTQTDTTDIIIDTSQEHRDIRISDGEQVLKIRLNADYKVQDILKDDIVLKD